jgi:HPt (histidine-containing phosphotransfer) domain-containing protein
MSELESRVNELRGRFIGGLAQRMANIDQMWFRARHEPEAASGETVRRALHSLAGTAATYRLTEIAAMAGQVEEAMENGQIPTVDALLGQLRGLLSGEEQTSCP